MPTVLDIFLPQPQAAKTYRGLKPKPAPHLKSKIVSRFPFKTLPNIWWFKTYWKICSSVSSPETGSCPQICWCVMVPGRNLIPTSNIPVSGPPVNRSNIKPRFCLGNESLREMRPNDFE